MQSLGVGHCLQRIVGWGLRFRDTYTVRASKLGLIIDVDCHVPVVIILDKVEAVADRLVAARVRVILSAGVSKQGILRVEVPEVEVWQLCIVVVVRLLQDWVDQCLVGLLVGEKLG